MLYKVCIILHGFLIGLRPGNLDGQDTHGLYVTLNQLIVNLGLLIGKLSY